MNYKIEDNLDLYTEINNCIIDDDDPISNNQKNDEAFDNICLLTNMPLEENFITLSCGHKFNYMAIYTETCNQKKVNYLDIAPSRYNEIKCPYCRTSTKNLLPYYCRYNVNKIRGVNIPSKYSLKLHECEYIYKSGKSSGYKCNNCAFLSDKGTLCNTHFKTTWNKKQKCLKNTDHTSSAPEENKYQNMPVRVLKDILRANKCKVGGLKMELVARVCSEKVARGANWIEVV
jgi:hypothetical protein